MGTLRALPWHSAEELESEAEMVATAPYPRARERREDARAPQLCGRPRRHSDPGHALARARRPDQPQQRQHAIPLFLGLSLQESSAACLRRLRAKGAREPAERSACARLRGFRLDFRPP